MKIETEATQAFYKDPVHKDGEYWYFWDETWSDRNGPFFSEEEARKELDKYCVFLNGETNETTN